MLFAAVIVLMLLENTFSFFQLTLILEERFL